jgi:membrane protease YdiL (CAAX protease family)
VTNSIIWFDQWLGRESKGLWIIAVCLIGILIVVLSTLSALVALTVVDHPLSPNQSVHTFITPHNKTTLPVNSTKEQKDQNLNTVDMLSIQFAGLLVYYAFREEVVFRLIPLTLVAAVLRHIISNDNIPTRLTILVIISLIFGYIHGGYDHLLVQGVSGLMFGIVYMKCGGSNYKSNIHVFRGLLCSTFVHYSVNYIFSIMTVVLYGMRYFGVP